MSERIPLASNNSKKGDPNRAVAPTITLWCLAAVLGLFIPLEWLANATYLSQLFCVAVLGAVIFFYAQDRRRWKGFAILFYLAVVLLKALIFIREQCGYPIFLAGTPTKSIVQMFGDAALLRQFLQTLFFEFVFGCTLVVTAYLRFSGRRRWWAMMLPTSLSMLGCTTIYALPILLAFREGPDAAALWQMLSCAAIEAGAILISAILCDWISSFSPKPLFLNTGAKVWAAIGLLVGAGALIFASITAVQKPEQLELLVFALLIAFAFLCLLARQRIGMAALVFGVTFYILMALRQALDGALLQLFIAMISVFVPAITWMIFLSSWRNTASPYRVLRVKKQSKSGGNTVNAAPQKASTAAETQTVAPPPTAYVAVSPETALKGVTQTIPIITKLPVQASPKELKRMAKEQLRQQKALWDQQHQEAKERERLAKEEQRRQAADAKVLARQQQKEEKEKQKQQKLAEEQQRRDAMEQQKQQIAKQEEEQKQRALAEKEQQQQLLERQNEEQRQREILIKEEQQQAVEQEKQRQAAEQQRLQAEKQKKKSSKQKKAEAKAAVQDEPMATIQPSAESALQTQVAEKPQEALLGEQLPHMPEEAPPVSVVPPAEQMVPEKQAASPAAVVSQQIQEEARPAEHFPLELLYPESYCIQCGQPFDAGSRFCFMCGFKREPIYPESMQDPVITEIARLAARTTRPTDERSGAGGEQNVVQPAVVEQRTAVAVKEVRQAKQEPPTPVIVQKQVYKQADNRGTMHRNVGQATSYWIMRRPNMVNKPPFLQYTFFRESDARAALLSLPYIHEAVDTSELICDFLMEYGYYEVLLEDNTTTYYEALVCGNDLTPQRYAEAQAAFEANGGQLKSEQAPQEYTERPQEVADVNTVVFKEEFVDNGKYRYRVYYAPNRASAIEFLGQVPVEEEFFYVMVDTPTGTYGRDIDGMYEV